ncbi:MAG: hypothetical protein RL367_1380 [Pseudomonadota bacterium]
MSGASTDLIIAGMALAGAVVAAAFGLYWNFRSAREARKLPFLQRQLDLCFEASNLVSILATSSDPAVWQAARARFWELYYGVLAVVEDPAIENVMARCGKFIAPFGPPPELPVAALCEPSLALSHAIRDLLFKAWKINIEPLAGKTGVFEQFKRDFDVEMAKQFPSKGGSAKPAR